METFLHKRTDDSRSANERALSEKLTSKITQINLNRVQKQLNKKFTPSDSSEDVSTFQTSKNQHSKVLFVCISGIPPFENEFFGLNLPGQIITFVLPGFQLDLSEQELEKRAKICDLDNFSQQINKKIQTYPNNYCLVFVYHSFGTFITVYYFKNFYEQQKHRIKGIIELGAAPIRIYPTIEPGIEGSIKMSRQFIQENVDFIFQKFLELQSKWKSQSGISTLTYKSKYNLMSLFLCYKTKGFNEIFDLIRKLPKILKLSIYGGRDNLFEVKNLDEKAIFYLYNQKAAFETSYAQELSQKYMKIYGQNPKNLQQKFIYKLEQGKHSLHMQKELLPGIQKIIEDYLQIIL